MHEKLISEFIHYEYDRISHALLLKKLIFYYCQKKKKKHVDLLSDLKNTSLPSSQQKSHRSFQNSQEVFSMT